MHVTGLVSFSGIWGSPESMLRRCVCSSSCGFEAAPGAAGATRGGGSAGGCAGAGGADGRDEGAEGVDAGAGATVDDGLGLGLIVAALGG